MMVIKYNPTTNSMDIESKLITKMLYVHQLNIYYQAPVVHQVNLFYETILQVNISQELFKVVFIRYQNKIFTTKLIMQRFYIKPSFYECDND